MPFVGTFHLKEFAFFCSAMPSCNTVQGTMFRPLVQKAMRVSYCLTRVSTENYNAGARLVDLVPLKAEIPFWRVLYLEKTPVSEY